MPDEKKLPHPSTHGIEPRKPEPATVKQRALDPTEPDIANQILNGLRDVKAEMKLVSDTHSSFAHELMSVGGKVSALSVDVAELKRWRQTGNHKPILIGEAGEPRTASGTTLEAVNDKVKTLSGRDLSQEAAIGILVADVTELKKSQTKQTQMLTSIYQDGLALWNDPKVKMLRGVVWMLLAAWAAKKGIKVGE